MTPRERKAPAGNSPTVTAPAAVASHALSSGRNGVASAHALPWDEWFQHASDAQREEMLALARGQGFLYARQLPPLTNGVAPSRRCARPTKSPRWPAC